MNIFALKGFKVRVTDATKNNGYASDIENVKKYLIIGKEYIVDHTVVYGSRTDVYLEEFKGIEFNSVNFEDITHQTKDEDMQHVAWKYYNK